MQDRIVPSAAIETIRRRWQAEGITAILAAQETAKCLLRDVPDLLGHIDERDRQLVAQDRLIRDLRLEVTELRKLISTPTTGPAS